METGIPPKKTKGLKTMVISIVAFTLLIFFAFYYHKVIYLRWQLKDGYWGVQSFSHQDYKMKSHSFVIDFDWKGNGIMYRLSRDTLDSPSLIFYSFTPDLSFRSKESKEDINKGRVIEVLKDTVTLAYKELPMFKIDPNTGEAYKRQEIWKFYYYSKMKKKYVIGEVKEPFIDLSL